MRRAYIDGVTEAAADRERIVGIVGGTGPESTIDYYRTLIRRWRRARPDGSYPRVIISSVEAGRVFRWLGETNMAAVGRELGSALRELAAAGCGRALIASNACHLAFDQIDPPPSVPVVHIVDATRDASLAAGHHRLGLLATTFVASSDLYSGRFAAAGLEVITPAAGEQTRVHDIYVNELVAGVIRDESRAALTKQIALMRERDSIDGVILGGTELALILTEPEYEAVPVLNTVEIHVAAAVDWLVEQGPDR